MHRAVFLDRDGLINVKAAPHDYVKHRSEFILLPGVPGAVRELNEAGFLVLVVTNQRGIARGLVSSLEVEDIHNYMREELARHGAHVDGVYVCPHEDGCCRCRKPEIGLFLSAEQEYEIDRLHSWTVGDSPSDIEAGRRYGSRTIQTADLPAAVKTILEGT